MGSPRHLKAVRDRRATTPQGGDSYTQAIIDSIKAHIAVIDRHGRIVMVNRDWVQFACANGDPHQQHTGPGVNYLDVLADALASDNSIRKAFEGIKSVLERRREFFSIEYPCHTPTADHWFRMVVCPLRHEAGGAVLTHHDITDLHTAQTERETLIAELSAHNEVLEKKRTILQRELSVLENHLYDPHTKITAHLYGAGPLRDLSPQAFQQLLVEYDALIPRALEIRAYRIDNDLSASLQAIAERIGSLNGGPRDIVDLHSEVLKTHLATASGSKAQALTDEARLMLVKLLSYLTAYYRRFAVGKRICKVPKMKTETRRPV